MNVQELKGRRIAKKIRQDQMAKKLHISNKTMNDKENSEICKFSVDDIKVIARECDLNLYEVNHIFFDGELPNGNMRAI